MVALSSARSVGMRWTLPTLWAVAIVGVAGAAVPFEKAVPDDCVAFVNVANVNKLKETLGQTRALQLFKDPAMKPFVDGVTGEITKLLDMGQQLTGIAIGDIFTIPTGQTALAIKLAPGEPTSIPFIYFHCDVKGKEKEAKELFSKLASTAEEQGIAKQTKGDVTIFSFGENKPRQSVVYAFTGTILTIGNDADSVFASVKALEGGLPKSLADSPRFQEFRKEAGGSGDVEIFIDVVRALEVAGEVAGAEIGSTISVLGLNTLQSAGVTFSVGKNDLETSGSLLLLVKGQSDLLNLINLPAKPIKPEPWVPENVITYTSFNWDLDKFYETLTKIVNAQMPGGLAQVEAMLAGPDPDNPIVNIKKDLIEPLGNRLTIVTDLHDSKEMKDGKPVPPVSRTLIAWELQDSERLKGLIDRVMQLAGGALPLQDKMVKGTKVYFFPLGDLLAAQMPDQELPLGVVGFAISKTHFFLATHVELLDKVLEFDGKAGLAENADFQKIAAKFPASPSLISFTRTDEATRPLYQLVKSGALAKAIRAQLEQRDEIAAFLGGIVDSLEGKNLPEFNTVKKYFGPSGAYAVMSEKGIVLTGFTVK